MRLNRAATELLKPGWLGFLGEGENAPAAGHFHQKQFFIKTDRDFRPANKPPNNFSKFL